MQKLEALAIYRLMKTLLIYLTVPLFLLIISSFIQLLAMVQHAYVNFHSRKLKKKNLVKILASELSENDYTLPKSLKQYLYKQLLLVT